MTAAADILDRFRDMPIVSAATVVGRRFVVLAPHPDDETLGCGGIIASACAAGDAPSVIILTDGGASHPGSATYPPEAVAVLRAQEAKDAARLLGLPADRLHLMGLPDGAAPHDEAGVTRASHAVANLAAGCDTLLVCWRHDPHPDHVAAYLVGRRAATRLGVRLLEYPVWGWRLPPDAQLPDTTWHGWRIDIAVQLPAKRRAIAAHRSQHGHVIADDPNGFILPAELLGIFEQPWETLVEAA